MHEIYELKEKLMQELKEYGSQEMSAGSLEVVDKLSHAIKNICKIIEAYEEEEGYSEEGGRGGNYRYSYEGGGGGRGGNQGGGGQSYRGGSYARGRGRNARRDSMGRYSSGGGGYSRNEGYGYSRAEEDMDSMIMELKEMMQDLPQDKKQEVQKFIHKIEQM